MDFMSHITTLALAASSTAPKFISDNNNGPTKIIYDYISAFGGVIIAFAIIMAGIKILLSAHKKDAREKAMDSLGKIIAGGFIIGVSLMLSGFIANIANQTGIEVINNNPTVKFDQNSNGDSSKDGSSNNNGTFVTRAVAGVIDEVPNKIFDFITDGTMGFESLDKLIFNTSSSGKSMPPFEDDEWHNLNYLYISICTIVAPLLLIMIAKTGVEMVLYSDSTSKKIDLKEELMRWFICAFLLGTAPFLVQGLFTFFNSFTDSLGTATKAIWGASNSETQAGSGFAVSTFKNLVTDSVITTAIIHLLYAWLMVKINLVFISRKVVLAVMYAFTPIAIALWGINKRVHAASIWFGEMITNAVMQFCYAFTFTVMLVVLGTANWNKWILVLVWMSAVIKIADMLRNSLQGFFTRLAGVDEASLAGGVFGTVGSTFAGMAAAFGMSTNNKEFKGSSVGGKVLGETLGNNNSKKNKTQGNGGISANMPSSKDTPDVKTQNSSSPVNGTSAAEGGTVNTSSGLGGGGGNSGSGSTPDVKSPNTNGAAAMPITRKAKKTQLGVNNSGLNPDGTGRVSPDLGGGNSNEATGNPNDDLPPIIPADSSDSTDVTNGEKPGSSREGINPSQGVLSKSSSNKSTKPADFKKKSNEQALYNSMLADNLNREMAKSSRRSASGIVTGAMQAATMNDPTMKGFVQGAGNIAAGIQKRRAVARAINKTADQMQQLSGGKMTKQEALTTLFGDSKVNYLQSNFKGFKVLSNSNNKAANWANNKIAGGVNGAVNRVREVGSNKQKFAGDIAKGNNDGAAMDLAAAHPFNKLNDEDKTQIIAQTNPYTSMDGFNHWDDEEFNCDY